MSKDRTDEQARRNDATKSFQVRIAEATIQHSTDPKRVAAARAHLEYLHGERTWESFIEATRS